MVTETKDRFVNTKAPIENDGVKRQPHERDESPDAQDQEPRGVMEQAAADPDGLEKAVDPAPGATGQAKPQPDNNESMRRHDTTNDKANKNNL